MGSLPAAAFAFYWAIDIVSALAVIARTSPPIPGGRLILRMSFGAGTTDLNLPSNIFAHTLVHTQENRTRIGANAHVALRTNCAYAVGSLRTSANVWE